VSRVLDIGDELLSGVREVGWPTGWLPVDFVPTAFERVTQGAKNTTLQRRRVGYRGGLIPFVFGRPLSVALIFGAFASSCGW
jgi:hypothetical protein